MVTANVGFFFGAKYKETMGKSTPIILTGTCLRLSKLKDAGPTVAVRIKMCGSKEEYVTMMVNPLHPQQGAGFNIGKAVSKASKAIAKGAKAAAPTVSALSDAAIIAGTLTAQPEVVALGTAGKAASKLAGAGQKKNGSPPRRKANRYVLSNGP